MTSIHSLILFLLKAKFKIEALCDFVAWSKWTLLSLPDDRITIGFAGTQASCDAAATAQRDSPWVKKARGFTTASVTGMCPSREARVLPITGPLFHLQARGSQSAFFLAASPFLFVSPQTVGTI